MKMGLRDLWMSPNGYSSMESSTRTFRILSSPAEQGIQNGIKIMSKGLPLGFTRTTDCRHGDTSF